MTSGPQLIKDELEAMLTEELSLLDIARRLNLPPTSIVPMLYDLYEERRIDIILRPDKIIVYKLREG